MIIPFGFLKKKVTGGSYLLDTYTPITAYSLRQLKTGVTDVIKVRRSSDDAVLDFTPIEITDGTLTTWVGANDGFIDTWYDQSGNSYDAVQATTTLQPQIVSSGALITRNGLPAIDFLDSRYLERSGGITDLATGNSFTTSYVATQEGSAQTDVFLQTTNDGTNHLRFYMSNSTFPRIIILRTGTYYISNYLAQETTTNQRLINGVVTSSTISSYYNNTAQETGVAWANTYSNDRFKIGGITASYLSGTAQEVIVMSGDQTSNLTAINTDINTYYTIY
jgi:hypothetical protein